MIAAFDLDDTLFDEREFCASAYVEVAGALSRRFHIETEHICQAMWESLLNRDNPFSRMERELDRLGIREPDITQEMLQIYRGHRPASLTPFRGVTDTLGFLREKGATIAIITDGRSATQRAKLKALGLLPLIDERDILISEEQGADKRSDLMFRRLEEMHPGETDLIYTGDNTEKDFHHPNLMGWRTVCLRHHRCGVHPQNFTREWPDAPQTIISGIAELRPVLFPR